MVKMMENEHGQDVPSYCQVLRFKDSNGQMKEMIFPKALDLDRPKRPRTTFSESQLNSLENEFQRNPYLIGKDRTRLAMGLGLSETQVKVWFQNRRTKSKRSKIAPETPSEPASPSSNSEHQSVDEDNPKLQQTTPTLIGSQKSEIDQPKNGFSNFNVNQQELKSSPPVLSNGPPIGSYLPAHRQAQSAFDFRFCPVNRPFSEFAPIAQQQMIANPPQQFLIGPMNTVGAHSQNPTWASQALWFPWSNQAAPCFQNTTPMK